MTAPTSPPSLSLRQTLRTWAADPIGRVALLLGLLPLLSLLTWPAKAGGLVRELLIIGFALVVAWAALQVKRRGDLDPDVRRVYGRLALAHLVLAIHHVGYLWVGDPGSADLGAQGVHLVYYLLVLWAALSLPGVRRPAIASLIKGLEGAALVVAGSMVIWYLRLSPYLAHTVVGHNLHVHALGNLLLFTAIVITWARQSPPSSIAALALVRIGFSLLIMADLMAGLIGQPLHPVVDSLIVLAGLYTLLLGVRMQSLGPPLEAVEEVPAWRTLPYITIVVSYILLGLHFLLAGQPFTAEGIVIGTMLISLLVMTRLLLTLRENERLLAEQIRSAEVLDARERRFRSLVQNSSDVVMLIDSDGVIRYVSDSVQRVFGYEPSTLLDRPLVALIHPEDADRVPECLRSAEGVQTSRWRHSNGIWRHVESTYANRLDDPDLQGMVLNTRDVTERIMMQRQMEYVATHDGLTGLVSRSLFTQRVSEALAAPGAAPGNVALLFADLDGFKRINDALGHSTGDLLLTAVARRLQATIGPTGLVSRFAGDEFVVLLRDTSLLKATMAAEQLIGAMEPPFMAQGRSVAVSPSVGIALNDVGTEQAADLLRNADLAMYHVKRERKGRYALFAPQMHEALLAQLELEADLRRAVERDEFILHYQPTVSLLTGQITGVEALIRWQHPERGLLLPQAFIPTAEESRLIVPMGQWVLREACMQVRRWQVERPTDSPLSVSVNLSSRELQQPDLVLMVAGTLSQTGLPPSSLVLEITESTLISDTEGVAAQLASLKALGVRVAMDDFGTGYSSLSYLRNLPIDIVKIDRSFVERLGFGFRDNALIETIVAVGRALQLETLAEGIESASQLPDLTRMGCQMGQGYHFARPAAADEIRQLMAELRDKGGAFQLEV